MVKKRKRKPRPKVLKAWWSEKYAKLGEKVTLNALTADAAYHTLNFQIYEFRRKKKVIKEIQVPVYHPEVSAKWKTAYKAVTPEYGNPEFRFRARVNGSGKTSKTLYLPAELQIALTFDDGPALLPKDQTRTITDDCLDILLKGKIKATFFVEHSRIANDYGKSILKRMVKEGHEIAIHGVDPQYHHVNHQDTKDFKVKLKDMRELIKSITGGVPKIYSASRRLGQMG